jgi:carbon-monoxide dehydrogenase medium subunit
MIPVSFDYARPGSLREAARLAASTADGGVILAGGQSLLTDLKQRTKRPRLVIDIAAIPGLDAIELDADSLRIGAMVRQADVAQHHAVVQHFPLLPEVAAVAADPMVRRRGTLVGALCEADPAGDWVAASLALDGRVVGVGTSGDWEMDLPNLLRGPRQTGLRAGDVAAAVVFPLAQRHRLMRYAKVKHPAIGWSVASVAAVVDIAADGRCSGAAIAVSGATAKPERLPILENELTDRRLADQAHVRRVVDKALAGLTFRGDYYASESYRAALLAVLLRRILADLAGDSS